MNIKGRILAMVSACVVIFSQSSITTFALDNQEVLTLPTSVSDLTTAESMGQVVKIHNLQGADEKTIAFCAEMESGYVIYDLSGNIITNIIMDCREAAWNIDTIVKCSMTASLLLPAAYSVSSNRTQHEQ